MTRINPLDIERRVREVIDIIWAPKDRPHPGPLPPERENHLTVTENWDAAIATTAPDPTNQAPNTSPSPPSEGGEGRGEVGAFPAQSQEEFAQPIHLAGAAMANIAPGIQMTRAVGARNTDDPLPGAVAPGWYETGLWPCGSSRLYPPPHSH
jgi:hypothetical protein